MPGCYMTPGNFSSPASIQAHHKAEHTLKTDGVYRACNDRLGIMVHGAATLNKFKTECTNVGIQFICAEHHKILHDRALSRGYVVPGRTTPLKSWPSSTPAHNPSRGCAASAALASPRSSPITCCAAVR